MFLVLRGCNCYRLVIAVERKCCTILFFAAIIFIYLVQICSVKVELGVTYCITLTLSTSSCHQVNICTCANLVAPCVCKTEVNIQYVCAACYLHRCRSSVSSIIFHSVNGDRTFSIYRSAYIIHVVESLDSTATIFVINSI